MQLRRLIWVLIWLCSFAGLSESSDQIVQLRRLIWVFWLDCAASQTYLSLLIRLCSSRDYLSLLIRLCSFAGLSESSDQTVQLCRLIWVFWSDCAALRAYLSLLIRLCSFAGLSESSDQTVQLRRLIWVFCSDFACFAGLSEFLWGTCDFVGFVIPWLMFCFFRPRSGRSRSHGNTVES